MYKSKKKIYFAGSIRAGRDDHKYYLAIINHLKKRFDVLTEHIGDKNLTDQGENKSVNYIFRRDVEWIKQADILVAEISQPSVGVGWEICLAEQLGKEVICLYRKSAERRISGMVEGNKYVKIVYYDHIDEIPSELDKLI